jgi:hypothetical protein
LASDFEGMSKWDITVLIADSLLYANMAIDEDEKEIPQKEELVEDKKYMTNCLF